MTRQYLRLFARALSLLALTACLGIRPAFAQSALTGTSDLCDDASKSPKTGVNESISGRLGSSASVSASSYVMIFPANADTEKYAAYLASGGKVVTLPGERPEDTSARVVRQMQDQTAKLPIMLRSMRMAIADKNGSFSCGGLAPGSYLIIAPVTVMQNDPNFGGRSLPHSSFYTARASVPKVKAGSRGRLIAPSSSFAVPTGAP